MIRSKKIMLLTSLPSSDAVGAFLIRHCLAEQNELEFFAVGGPRMGDAGASVFLETSELVSSGWLHTLLNLKQWWATRALIIKKWFEIKPDLLIIMDAAPLHFKIASLAKQASIKTLYYTVDSTPPSTKIINLIQETIDQLAFIFPFQVEQYQQVTRPKTSTGNPSFILVLPSKTRMDRCLELNLDYHEPIVGLLPGSQLCEFRRLLPAFMKTFQKIQARFPQAQCLLLLPETISEILVEEIIGDDLNARIITTDLHNTIHLCDVIITSSPRLTLDLALLETPMVLIRDTAQKSPTLCNLIAEKHIVKEFTRDTDGISQEVISLLNADVTIKNFKEDLRLVKSKLQVKEGQASIGKLVLSLLNPQSSLPG